MKHVPVFRERHRELQQVRGNPAIVRFPGAREREVCRDELGEAAGGTELDEDAQFIGAAVLPDVRRARRNGHVLA